MKTCSIESCEKKLLARGYCTAHYTRLIRHGSPTKGSADRFSDPAEAFAAKTAPAANGCIEWTGSKTNGYGQIFVSGKLMLAHRYSWERTNGPIPNGHHVDHMCFNPACVNPGHLRVATNKQNMEHRSGLNSNNKSGYRGVFWQKTMNKWTAKAMSNSVTHSAGYFDTPEEANDAAIELRNKLFTHNLRDRAEAS